MAAGQGFSPAADEEPSGTLVGRLLDPGGYPARAPLVLVPVLPGEEWWPDPVVCPSSERTTATRFLPVWAERAPDVDGAFQFDRLPAGSWRVAHYDSGAFHVSQPLEVAPGALTDAGVLQLAGRSPVRWVRGRMRWESGPNWFQDGRVLWWRDGHDGGWRSVSLEVTREGRFAIPLPAEAVSVTLFAWVGRESYAFAEDVPVPSEDVELVLRPRWPVALRLEDGSGAPVECESVELHLAPDSGRRYFLEDRFGREFGTVRVPEERFLVRYRLSDDRTGEAGPFEPADVLAGPGSQPVLAIRVPDADGREPPDAGATRPWKLPPVRSSEPRDRALDLLAAGPLDSHIDGDSLAPMPRRGRRGRASTSDHVLAGRLTLGGRGSVPLPPDPLSQILCGSAPAPLGGWRVGLAPLRRSAQSVLWYPVERDGRFAVPAREPGRYRLLVSAEIDPLVDEFNEGARLLAQDVVEIGSGEPSLWERDLAVGGVLVRRDQRTQAAGSSRVLVWTTPDGVSGVLGLDRWDDRLEYRVPCVPAGPAEVYEVARDGSARFVASLVVPEGGTAAVDLR